MTKNSSQKQKTFRKFLMICLATVIIAGITLVVLEKTNAINIIDPSSKDIKASTEQTKTNNVNYDPPTSEQQGLADQIKYEAEQNNSTSSSYSSESIDVSLSAATQDVSGGPIVVKAIVGVSDGSCTVTLSGSAYNKEYATPVENLGTYYGCGMNISVNNIPAGNYTLKLIAKNGDAIGSATQSVEVSK